MTGLSKGQIWCSMACGGSCRSRSWPGSANGCHSSDDRTPHKGFVDSFSCKVVSIPDLALVLLVLGLLY